MIAASTKESLNSFTPQAEVPGEDRPPNRGDNGRGRLVPISKWSLDELESKIAELKADIFDFKNFLDRSNSDSEAIVWQTPFKGEILDGKAKRHHFFIENDCIYLIEGAFCVSERACKTYHHIIIRQAIEAGKFFDPSSTVGEPCEFGRIHQSCDGWWWAWSHREIKGHQFLTQLMALKYLQINAGNNDSQAS